MSDKNKGKKTLIIDHEITGGIGDGRTYIAWEKQVGNSKEYTCIGGINGEDNTHRIVTCVNALDGVSNKALESGVIARTRNVLENVIDTYEQLLHGGMDGYDVDKHELHVMKAILTKLEGGE